jgi:hypothetical protein
MVTVCSHCTTEVECFKFSTSRSGNGASVQLASWVQSFVMSLYLFVCDFSVCSINNNYLHQMCVKRHEYICLIWRKHEWLSENHVMQSIEKETELPVFPPRLLTTVQYYCWCEDDVSKFKSCCLNIFLMIVLYSHKYSIKLCSYILFNCMIQSFAFNS